MSLKKFASSINKKRFSVKYPDGKVERFGTCREEEDERYDIVCWNGLHFLTQFQLHDTDYSQPPKHRILLPEGTLIANGYYDHEHDIWATPQEWIEQV